MISMDTFHYGSADRPSLGSEIPGGFGSVLPRHQPSHSARMLESTAMASWN